MDRGTIIEGDIKEAYEAGQFDLNNIKFPFIWKNRTIFEAGNHPDANGNMINYPDGELSRTAGRAEGKPIILPEHDKQPGKVVGFARNATYNTSKVVADLELLSADVVRLLARGVKWGLSPAYSFIRAKGLNSEYTYDPDYDEISFTFNPNARVTMLNSAAEKQELNKEPENKMDEAKIDALEKDLREIKETIAAMSKEKEDKEAAKSKENETKTATELAALKEKYEKDKAELEKAQGELAKVEKAKTEKEIAEMVEKEIQSGRVPKEHREGRIKEAESMSADERKGIIAEMERTDGILRKDIKEGDGKLPEKQTGGSETSAGKETTIAEDMLNEMKASYDEQKKGAD